jgi:hypothetical protein
MVDRGEVTVRVVVLAGVVMMSAGLVWSGEVGEEVWAPSGVVESAAVVFGEVEGPRLLVAEGGSSGSGDRSGVPGDVNGDGVADAGDVACAVGTVYGDIGCAVAPLWGGVSETGQQTCYDPSGDTVDAIPCAGTGQDGELRPGGEWPTPRFTHNGDGTVTDNLTGLIWLGDASCADLEWTDSSGRGDWSTALSAAAALADGTCGLTDGSEAGDWRLPSRFELESLLDLEYAFPALSNAAGTGQWAPGDAFGGVQSSYYWSSSSYAYNPQSAWNVTLYNGGVYYNAKTNSYDVWPVRRGR